MIYHDGSVRTIRYLGLVTLILLSLFMHFSAREANAIFCYFMNPNHVYTFSFLTTQLDSATILTCSTHLMRGGEQSACSRG